MCFFWDYHLFIYTNWQAARLAIVDVPEPGTQGSFIAVFYNWFPFIHFIHLTNHWPHARSSIISSHRPRLFALRCFELTSFCFGRADGKKAIEKQWPLLGNWYTLALTSFLHLGANYVRVKRQNTSGGHKSLAEWRHRKHGSQMAEKERRSPPWCRGEDGMALKSWLVRATWLINDLTCGADQLKVTEVYNPTHPHPCMRRWRWKEKVAPLTKPSSGVQGFRSAVRLFVMLTMKRSHKCLGSEKVCVGTFLKLQTKMNLSKHNNNNTMFAIKTVFFFAVFKIFL